MYSTAKTKDKVGVTWSCSCCADSEVCAGFCLKISWLGAGLKSRDCGFWCTLDSCAHQTNYSLHGTKCGGLERQNSRVTRHRGTLPVFNSQPIIRLRHASSVPCPASMLDQPVLGRIMHLCLLPLISPWQARVSTAIEKQFSAKFVSRILQ